MDYFFQPQRDARVRDVRDDIQRWIVAWSPSVQEVCPSGHDSLIVYIHDGRSYEITVRERVG